MNKEARVGLLFALTMALLGITLFYIGNFQKSHSYYIEFFDINGLALDSPVHFNGVPIGRVTAIELKETEEEPTTSIVPIKVSIAVDRSAQSHIRTSTEATIRSIGVLGDKYVRLYTTDYKAAKLKQNERIKTAESLIDVEKLIAQGKDWATDVTDITQSVQSLLQKIESKDGVLQKLITDPVLAESFGQNMEMLLQNFKNRKSILGMLGNDPALSNQLRQHLISITQSLDSVIQKVEKNQGILKLITEDEVFKEQVQSSINTILTQLDVFIKSVKEAKGLAHVLIYDREYAKRVSQNLEKSTFHLASILEKIDKGDGTISKLLNEPELYDGVSDIVYGVENSGFTKWYINRKREKGQKLKAREGEAEE
ncbi:MAG: hypothetical protein CR997_07335 [Acidobacteria bacterium]|nr:MAG: hypothetical protein CR997_07335 [Acidobacteriota bacterium]